MLAIKSYELEDISAAVINWNNRLSEVWFSLNEFDRVSLNHDIINFIDNPLAFIVQVCIRVN